MKKLRIIRALCLIVALGALMLGGCGSRESALIGLVPSDSCAVVVLDWPSIKNDNDFSRLLKSNDLEAQLLRLGVDSSSVKTIVVFSAFSSQSKTGLLLRGLFEKQKQLAALKAHGWREESIEGHQLYVNGSDYAIVPQANILFAGTRDAALAVWQVVSTNRGSVVASPSFKKLSAGLATSNSPFKAFLIIPEGALAVADTALEATSLALSLFDLGGVGALLKQINFASGFGLSMTHASNQMYPVEMCVLMRDEKAAAILSGSLKAMKGLSTMVAGSNRDQEGVSALQNMTITRQQEVLAIKTNLPRAALFPPTAR